MLFFKWLFIIVIILVLSFILYIITIIKIQKIIYKANTKFFTKVSPSSLIDIIKENTLNNVTTIVYFGRPTCPYCRILINDIKNVVKNSKKNVFYIETQTNSTNHELESLRNKYSIEFIPTIIKINPDSIDRYDSKNKFEPFLNF